MESRGRLLIGLLNLIEIFKGPITNRPQINQSAPQEHQGLKVTAFVKICA